MKKLIIVFLIAGLSAGCAAPPPISPSRPSYEESQKARRLEVEQALASWHGLDVNKLLVQFGPPTSTYVMPSGDIIYTFFWSRTLPGLDWNFECSKSYVVNKSTSLITGTSYKGCVWPL